MKIKVNLSLKSYLSRGRTGILLGSIVVGAILVAIAHRYHSNSGVFDDLAINLAASAFTTAIALTYLDYILKKEELLDVADGHGLAEEEINITVWRINNTLAKMYGFDFKSVKLPKVNAVDSNHPSILDIFNKEAKKYLDQIEEAGDMKLLSKVKLEDNLKSLKGSLRELDSLMSRYGYALTNKEKSAILKLRKLLNTLHQITSLFGDMADKDPSIQSSIKKAAIEVYRAVRADFSKHLK